MRRWPRISASSRMPPRATRTNLRPIARAIDSPSDVLPTPGGPTSVMIEPGAALRRAALGVVVDVALGAQLLARRGTRRSATSRRPGRSGRRRGSPGPRSRSMVSSLRMPHGSSKTRSSHVRIQPCSGDWALVRSRRSISLATKLRAASAASSDSSFVRYSPTTSSSPSPSSLRMAASCWRSRYSRCCLSTPSVTSLRIVSATCSSARWSRAHVSTSSTRSATSTAASTSRRASSSSSAHVTTPSASAPGSSPVRSSSGRRRERRSWAICSSTTRSSRASASTRGVGRGSRRISASANVAPRSEAWTAAMRARASTRTMATGSPVGSEPMSGTWATTASWSSPARRSTRRSAPAVALSTARRGWSVTRARVMTAPGRTVAGRSARGSRVLEDVAVLRSLMDRRVSIHRQP